MMLVLQWKVGWFVSNIVMISSHCRNSDGDSFAVEDGWLVAYIGIMTSQCRISD
jgi:hypothetical protein